VEANRNNSPQRVFVYIRIEEINGNKALLCPSDCWMQLIKFKKNIKEKKIQTAMFYTRYGKMVERYCATGARDHSTFS